MEGGFDVAAAEAALAGVAFAGAELGEGGLPEAEDGGLDAAEAGDLTDAETEFVRDDEG